MDNDKYNVFDYLIEGVQVINPHWEYIYVNDSVVRHSKSTRIKLLGSTMMEVYPGIENTEMFSFLKKCMVSQTTERLINEFKFPDGTRGWFELILQAVPEGVLILSVDITSLKEAEKELERKVMEREQMLKQIVEQKKQLEEFCHIIAHNLRAPLSNLILLSDMIGSSNSIEERLMLMEKQKPVIDLLNETFEELVDATQVRTNSSIKRDNVNLESSAHKALKLLENEIKEAEAEINFDFSIVNTVHFPQKYIDSIFYHLISNAIKYRSPERKPEIKISSYFKNDWVYLEVSDNGLGIDLDNYKDKIFKLRKTFHNHPKARGFGLFIIKNQIETMGGRIKLSSNPGQGSTFTVRLSKIYSSEEN